ncbi:polyprenyl synthetase family protein [Saccharicrinis sp. FJH62]|uniref:polyprenyl synthetase family protein n=1 Tax=Saccharicrinis sp. FJH62 TaxID=3344657 RepID=UPI0035D442D1
MNFTDALNQVEQKLEDINFDRQPRGLYDPIAYALANGGKRIRPAMVLMAHSVFDSKPEKALMPAVGIEVFHNFTLLHDDIMDNADIRRGKQSVHLKWDENTAILSGDAMLIMAYQYVAGCDPEYLAAVQNEFSKVALEICEGQQYDMDFENRDDVTIEEYLNMIRLKTAVLLGSSLKIGAITGGASVENANHLYNFGINIGLAFQLMDDILDVYADKEEFGKEPGGDIISNKKTYLLLTALKEAKGNIQEELNKWINAVTFDREEKYHAVRRIYDETDVKNMASQKMESYYNTAMHELDKVSGDPEALGELRNLADSLMKRTK